MTAMNSVEIFAAIEEIAAVGKNEKIELLKRYMSQAGDFSRIIAWAVDPFITFGIRPNRQLVHGSGMFDSRTHGILQRLCQRSLTGDDAKQEVNDELIRLNPESAELFWRIINKDLKAGFSESTVNKAVKGFIQEFPYMRCSLPKDANCETWPWATGVISQIKADGMFFDGNVEASSVSLTSRQGQPFPAEGFEELSRQLSVVFSSIGAPESLYEKGAQTHGELLILNEFGEVMPRQIGNGLINKLIKGTPLPKGMTLSAVLWDVVPLSCVLTKGKFDEPYLNRLRTLNSAIGYLKASGENSVINTIETRVVRSYEEAMEHYMDARRRKLEGTIAKKPSMIWKDGTSKDQVKLKQEVPVELEVYGFEEGKEGAKTADTFGSLMCRTSDDLLRVNVGTGFSDELRREINESREDWIGAIITVKGNEIMYAARGKLVHSIFLPVYVERRLDKSVADTFQQVVDQFESAIK